MSSKLESDVCCRLQIVPSGESYEGKRRSGRKQWQTTAGYMAWFTSRHLRADCPYTGISSGPTLGNEYGKTLPFNILTTLWLTATKMTHCQLCSSTNSTADAPLRCHVGLDKARSRIDSAISKKAAHTRLPSVGFRSWCRFLAVSLKVTWVINPAVGCHYFPPGLQLPPQHLRGLLPILLLGEHRHDECKQFA